MSSGVVQGTRAFVGVVLYSRADERVGLVQEVSGLWGICCGHVEGSESVVSAAGGRFGKSSESAFERTSFEF